MQLAEHLQTSVSQRRHLVDIDEANDLIRSGNVRDALKALMRGIPDEFERSGITGAGQSRVPACPTGLCYALMGMYSDAKEWCTSKERGASAACEADADRVEKACLRLWCLVAEGDLRAAMLQSLELFCLKDFAGDVLHRVVAGTVVLALKLEDHGLAREIASLVAEPGPCEIPHVGAALLEVCRAELRFRELVAAMPEFSASVAGVNDLHTEGPAPDRLTLASRAESLAAHIDRLERRLDLWPLLQEGALMMRVASEMLALQFLGRNVDLSSLELRISSFHARGLTPLHRHGRFLLALLNLHQGRPATAQNWLGSVRSSEHESREHLLAASVRVSTKDWSHAFELYQRYVKRAAPQARIAGELRAKIITALRPNALCASLGDKPQGSFAMAGEAIQANESRFLKDARQLHALSTPRAPNSQTVETIRYLIEENLAQPLLVSEIAARLGIARRTVENRVRLESGHSVKRFVTALRLEHAYRLVQDGAPIDTHTLQTIAAQVGFSSYRTFCAAYTRSFGRIPHRRGRP